MGKVWGWVRWGALWALLGSFALGPGLGERGTAQAANEGKVFLTTTSYGVIAGSLTGLASLAFYQRPGQHMKNIALGASLGLYAGILMGAYLIYLVPDPYAPRRRDDSEIESLHLDSRQEPVKKSKYLASLPMPYVAPLGADAYGGGILWKF
jgi:hypothetical protein